VGLRQSIGNLGAFRNDCREGNCCSFTYALILKGAPSLSGSWLLSSEWVELASQGSRRKGPAETPSLERKISRRKNACRLALGRSESCTVPQREKKNEGRVKAVTRPLPLGFHPALTLETAENDRVNRKDCGRKETRSPFFYGRSPPARPSTAGDEWDEDET